jgi:cell wall-associated NlpC family hydrolase
MNPPVAGGVSLDVGRRRALALLALLGCGCGASTTSGARATAEPEPALTVVTDDPAAAPSTAAAPLPVWVDPYELAREEAARTATPAGRRVLDAADAMLEQGVVVQGSCWGWTAAVFERAGGSPSAVFRGRQAGPWAEAAALQPGDWLYFVPGEGGGTHSAIFVGWIEGTPPVGLTISYVGGRREETGRYSTYDLSRVYRVVRLAE